MRYLVINDDIDGERATWEGYSLEDPSRHAKRVYNKNYQSGANSESQALCEVIQELKYGQSVVFHD